MGEFLKAMPKNEGAKGGRTSLYVSKPGTAFNAEKDGSPTMKEIGISYHESHTAQKLADIPAPEFRERIEAVKLDGGKLSTAAIIGATRRPAGFGRGPDAG